MGLFCVIVFRRLSNLSGRFFFSDTLELFSYGRARRSFLLYLRSPFIKGRSRKTRLLSLPLYFILKNRPIKTPKKHPTKNKKTSTTQKRRHWFHSISILFLRSNSTFRQPCYALYSLGLEDKDRRYGCGRLNGK